MTAIARNSSIPLKIQKQLGGWLSHQNDFYFCEGCPSVPRSPRNALERANKVCQYSHCKPVTVTDDSVDLKGKYIRSFVVVGKPGSGIVLKLSQPFCSCEQTTLLAQSLPKASL